MKYKFDVRSMIVGALLGAASVLTTAAVTGGRTTWNYHIIYGRLSSTIDLPSIGEQLDQAASNGWEVVAATSENGSPILILRRPQ